MRARSVNIVEAFQLVDFSDQSRFDLTAFLVKTGGGNVLTALHGSHMHVRAKGLDLEFYDNAMPLWLVYSEGNYFAFTDEEFKRYYEPADKDRIAARVVVQSQKDFQNGAQGVVFQALVNSGLTRDQALDGLIEIMATGIVFGERSSLVNNPNVKHGKSGRLIWVNGDGNEETNDA